MSAQRTVWVTGGSTGIGARLCERFVGQGLHVVNFSRRAPALAHPSLRTVTVDLTDPAAARAAVESAADAPADIIVHNAGATRERPVGEATLEDLAALSQLHLGTALLLLQASLAHMRRQRSGRIVLISSRAALGLANRTAYGATKAGMIGLARTWALELAADGITVNVVAPGPIEDTEMFTAIVPAGSERHTRLARAIPVGRLGRADDVVRAVEFFAAPEASFVTGQTLFVCGGASVGTLTI